MTKVKHQECQAHFKGSDGQGTCDTQCQWYRPNVKCPNSVMTDREKRIIKKPEKKDDESYERVVGYNQACDDWEKFLPNEEEILKIIDMRIPAGVKGESLAKAISKRIRGKK